MVDGPSVFVFSYVASSLSKKASSVIVILQTLRGGTDEK